MILNVTFPAFKEILKFLSDAVEDNLGSLTSLAVVLAAMLAAYSLIKTSASYIEGERNFGWSLARPIVILFIVMEFPLVFNAFDSIVNIFTDRINETYDTTMAELVDALRTPTDGTYELQWGDGNGTAAVETPTTAKGFWDKLVALFKTIVDMINQVGAQTTQTITSGIFQIVEYISIFIMQIVYYVVQVLVAIYLTILKLLGMFIFALSIVNAWKGGLVGYLARYIQISLWIPTGGIIMFLQLAVIQGTYALAATVGNCGMMYISVVLALGVMASIFSIPKIASWVIESTGSANAQSALEKGAQMAAAALVL